MNSLLVINKSKKILVVTGAYPPEIGGEATYAKLLKEELPNQSGDKVRAIILNSSRLRLVFKPWRWLSVFVRTLYLGRYCDVVYALNLKDSFPASRAARLLKKPFWLKLSAEDVWPMTLVSGDKGGLQIPRNLGRLIVPSEEIALQIRELGGKDKQVCVIPNAFTAPMDLDTHDRIRQKWGVKGQVVLTAGRFIKRKNFQTLVKAVPAVLVKYPDAKILIAGDGPERPTLEKLIDSLNLADSVMLTGILSRETLFVYLRLADVFVSPSLYEVGSPSLLEAKTLGTPIVATLVGDNKNLLDGYAFTTLVPDFDSDTLASAIIKSLGSEKRKITVDTNDDPAGEMAIELIRLLLNN